MTHDFEGLREYVTRATAATTVLAALATTLDAEEEGAAGDAGADELRARARAATDAAGLGEAVRGLDAAQRRQLLAEISFHVLSDTQLLASRAASPGWNHTDGTLLQAGGDVSAPFATVLTRRIVPALEGLSERLSSPGAAFLDVGAGVGGLSVALARLWPRLNVVGIDPWEPSVALGRENILRADLADRVQLRVQAAEELTDADAYDAAWIPGAFLPASSLPTACARVFQALRPGGWLLLATADPGPDPLSASLVRFRVARWGGHAPSPATVRELLEGAGFAATAVREILTPPGSLFALTAVRKGGE
jgi:SAM-dependent methyltransferase